MIGYAVMRLRKWDFQSADPAFRHIPIEVNGTEGSIGFIEVFGTLESANAAASYYDGETLVLPVTVGPLVNKNQEDD